MFNAGKILMPRVSPPKDNPNLSNEDQLGIDLEEMVRREGHKRAAVEKAFRTRFERLIEFCQWELLLNGFFEVNRHEKEARKIGPGSVPVVESKEQIKATLEGVDRTCWLLVNTKTMRDHMAWFNELARMPYVELFTNDRCYTESSTSEEAIKFLSDGTLLTVTGPGKIGRIFRTKAKFEIHTVLDDDFLRGRQRFLPELLEPERLLVYKGL